MEYKIVLEPDVEDGGYVVHGPALAGCYSQGETKEEATENIRETIEAYLESLEQDGVPIPHRARHRTCQEATFRLWAGSSQGSRERGG